jgi:hypothetical protein
VKQKSSLQRAPAPGLSEMAPSVARAAVLLLCVCGLQAAHAFSPLSLAGAGTGAPAARVSNKCRTPMAATPLPLLCKRNVMLKAIASEETDTSCVIQSTDANSIANRVAAAKPGDTIELERVRAGGASFPCLSPCWQVV